MFSTSIYSSVLADVPVSRGLAALIHDVTRLAGLAQQGALFLAN